MDHARDVVAAVPPSRVLGQRDPGTRDLPAARRATQLTRLPELAPQALRQAQHAIDLGIRLGRAGQTVCYEDLGIYRLLLQVGDMHQLWQFAQDVLGPLIDYDARHKVGLVGTLSVYLNQHESLKQTARVLRIHVNTVTYRIQRIEQLTSLDLTNPDHRLSAHVAAKIIESQRSRRPLPELLQPDRDQAVAIVLPGIGSASAARQAGARKGSAKYCVSCATCSCANSMMLTE
jgi:hypothetical protein